MRNDPTFPTILTAQARVELDRQAIEEIQVRVSKWFEENDLLEEAIQLLLSIDRAEDAAALIVRDRNAITNAE